MAHLDDWNSRAELVRELLGKVLSALLSRRLLGVAQGGENEIEMAYSDKELKNIAGLRASREARGLSISALERTVGIAYSTIRAYEIGDALPTPHSYNKLAKFFGWETVLAETGSKRPEPPPEFVIGHVYLIKGKKLNDRPEGYKNLTGADMLFAFRYDGKKGNLLQFTEIHGGWTRTYAVYQLIGKKIMEVK